MDGLAPIEVHEQLKLLKEEGPVTAGANATVITLKIKEAYKKVVNRMDRQTASLKALAMRILARMIFSYRPLALAELQHALLDPASPDFQVYPISEHLASFTARRIAQACAGFIVVEQSNNRVRLIHKTAQQFLENHLHTLDQNNAGMIDTPVNQAADVHKTSQHKVIALGCVAYLSQSGIKARVDSMQDWKTRLKLYPFYEYAADYWDQHAHAGDAEGCEPILSFQQDEDCMANVGPIVLPPPRGSECGGGQRCWLNRMLPKEYNRVLPRICSWVT